MGRVVTLDARLDAARAVGDPEADAVVASLGHDVWAVNRLLAPITRAEQALPAGLSPALARLVVPPLPGSLEWPRVRRAQAFAHDHLPAITVALFCAALPASYASPEGARILRLTGRLEGDLDRRVNETGRFILEVLRPGSLEPGGRARVAIGKVRLVHAAVRAAVRARGGEAGTPINQEDQLGTLGVFSVVVLKALCRLGVPITRVQEDFIHLWRAIGVMLGVHDDELFASWASAEATVNRIRARRCAPSADGRLLMQALLAGMERHMVLPMLRAVPGALVRYLLGDDLADLLGIAGPAGAPRRWDREPPSALTRGLAVDVGRRLLEALNGFKLGGAPVSFPMPTRLAAPPRE
jgi:hypothetical protein